MSRPATRTGEFAWAHAQVPSIIMEIVSDEGPIAERLLARRLADVWGLKRARQGSAATPRRCSRGSRRSSVHTHRDGFFWPRRSTVRRGVPYRVPDQRSQRHGATPRTSRSREIANAAEDLLARYGQMPREDLARAVAKHLRFRGLTKVVAQRVDLGILHASQRST